MTLRPPSWLVATIAAVALVAGACSGGADTATSAGSEDSTTSAAQPTSATQATSEVFDATLVHEISVQFDQGDYEEMIETYRSDSTKEWIEATVTIDGVTYDQAGIRLKGNSSLAGLGGGRFGGGGGTGGDVSADAPEGLPWLIKLNKYVDDQTHEGVSDFVVRSNSSQTALNEAVALDLLEAAGLATQDAIAVRFSVNGSDQVLRLVIEHPDDVWMAQNFDVDDALYKAESTGDYSYRGEDEAAYDEVFDQEAGKDNTDLTPLIEFLDFINTSDDQTFAADLADHLDVESFAVYLAMQDIVDNFDDIDGPGNNSYLHWDADTGRFTVVPWDYNLAFGGLGGGPGGGGPGGGGFGDGPRGGFDPEDLPEGFEPPAGFDPEGLDLEDLPEGFDPEGFEPPDGGRGGFGGPGGGGGFGGSNVLVQRFLAVDAFDALYQQALTDLTADLVDSGVADQILDQWVAVLTDQAADLVDAQTIQSEADQVRDML